MKVIYSVNGKYFKGFGVEIAKSIGLLDKPKPKPRRSYDWAEYHGKAVDLSPLRYDERKIELKGWIEGQSWWEMTAQFNQFIAEFEREGLARLVVDYGKELVYDVYLDGSVELEKTFREGEVVGLFTLKLSEPSPLKRVYKVRGSDLNLSFNARDVVEVNIDGEISYHKGDVAIAKKIKQREVGNTPIHGRNYYTENSILNGYYGGTVERKREWNGFQLLGSSSSVANFRIGDIFPEPNATYTVSFIVSCNTDGGVMYIDFNDREQTQIFATTQEKKVSITKEVGELTRVYNFIDISTNYNYFYIKDFKIEKGNVSTKWSNAPEDVHFITISGDIDGITNLQISDQAELLWENL